MADGPEEDARRPATEPLVPVVRETHAITAEAVASARQRGLCPLAGADASRAVRYFHNCHGKIIEANPQHPLERPPCSCMHTRLLPERRVSGS